MYIRARMSQSTAPVGVEGELPNYTTLSRTTIGGWSAILFGALTIGMSVYIGLAVLGVVGGTKHAPDWVLWAAALVFGIGGLMLAVYGVVDLIISRRSARDAMLHPEDAWRADYVWSSAMGKPGMKSRESGWWVMSMLGMLIVVCFTMVSTWVSMTGPGGLVGVFLWFMSGVMYLCFLLFGWVFVKQVLAAFRYGMPRVVYETMPIRAGEMLNGRVLCPRGFGALDRVTITLRHVVERYERVPSSSGKQKSKVRCRGIATDQWVIEDVKTQLGDGSGQGELPVVFLIPEDAQDTRASARPARYWDLEVRGEAKGVDFVHRFAVPVYSW